MTADSDPVESPHRRPTWRGVLLAALYGIIVATLGYVIGRGNIFVAVLVMAAIGVLLRLLAYRRIRRAGCGGAPWWKWL